jgi:hypothetical protein
MKLVKPIFPARDLGYIPNYKNIYLVSGSSTNNVSVVGQKFNGNGACEKNSPPFNQIPNFTGICPEGYSSLYQKYGLAGHNGIDIPCANGTPIFASHDGIVTKLSTKETHGLGVTITSDDGTFKTLYWHLKEIKATVGQKVRAFDLIGLGDSTGKSTGNHLHFGLYPTDEPLNNGYAGAVDPLPYIVEKPTFNFTRNLFFGRSGEDVRNLQIALAHEGFLGQVGFEGFTGFFGRQTLEAVKRFQKKYDIINTGLVGKLTIKKLNEIYG